MNQFKRCNCLFRFRVTYHKNHREYEKQILVLIALLLIRIIKDAHFSFTFGWEKMMDVYMYVMLHVL